MAEEKTMKRARPEVGATTVRIDEIEVCLVCGCATDLGMCSYECDEDGSPRTSANAIIAKYEVTAKFLGDSPYTPDPRCDNGKQE